MSTSSAIQARHFDQIADLDARTQYGRPTQHIGTDHAEARQPFSHQIVQRAGGATAHFSVRELDRQQRIAAAFVAQTRAVCARRALVDDPHQSLGGKRADFDLRQHAIAPQAAQRLLHRRVVTELAIARREHGQERLASVHARHVVQRSRARFVAPLHVVEQQHHRALGGLASDQIAQAREQTVAIADVCVGEDLVVECGVQTAQCVDPQCKRSNRVGFEGRRVQHEAATFARQRP